MFVAVLGLVAACGGAAPEPASPATKPDRAKLTLHLKEHVKYPSNRGDLLKACADTPEFTAGEKKWFASSLAEGTYQSADEVLAAVKY
jgi:hypothetical protein